MPRRFQESRKEGASRLLRRALDVFRILANERIFTLICIVACIVAGGAGLVYSIEHASRSTAFSDFFDAVWWAVVTVTTVGYGDRVPQIPGAKVVAGFLMFFGITLLSILSGTIASIIVSRRLREGSGLEKITGKHHVLVCGWNRNAGRMLAAIAASAGLTQESVVLVCELAAEEWSSLRANHPDLRLRFVRGDFVNESVLKKAGVEGARAAVILADQTGRTGQGNADERTILSAFLIKSLNRDIILSAELLNPDNEPHLRRANVDNILVQGEFNGYLFAHSASQPGLTRAAKELLAGAGQSSLTQCHIPPQFVGKTFKELSDSFLQSGKGVLVGFLSQEKKMNLDDILSDDTSAIDSFILRKFKEADIDLAEEQKAELAIKLNPGPDYVIGDTDRAFVIGRG